MAIKAVSRVQLGANDAAGADRWTLLLGTCALLGLVANSIIGTFGALAFILFTLALGALNPLATLRDLLKFSPLLFLPILAMLSTLWSAAPQGTLRASLQLFLTCIAGIVVARRLSANAVLLILFVGYAVVALLMVPTMPKALSSGLPLDSWFLGSKNQVGFAAHVLIALSFAIAVQREQPLVARLATIAAIPVAVAILFLSQSAGARTSLMITLLTFPPFLILGRVKMSWRIAILLTTFLMLAVALAFLPDLAQAWSDFRLNVLKKDASLTGRTYLWETAARITAERPLLGQGYAAFWRQGNIDAEGLWRWGGIAARGGFNFHNDFIEMRVDLGIIGMSLLLLTCVGVALAGLARQIARPSVPIAFLLSFITVLYARSYTEVGLLAPFSMLTVLWLATAVYAFDPTAVPESPRVRRASPARRTQSLEPRRI